MAIRTVPVCVWAYIHKGYGPGSFAGVLTMMMCSIGLRQRDYSCSRQLEYGGIECVQMCRNGFIARLRHGRYLSLSSSLRML
ncbi:MAG: hypothetical protein ACLS9K_10905 [Lachnospira eligens]